METIDTLALTLGASWAAGINLYATILVLGYLSLTGHVVLPPGLDALNDPLVLGVAGMMYFIEFFADKTPGVDSGWDAIHTFIRIPAGALLAAGAASNIDVSQTAELAAVLVGGSMAASSHFTKAGSRLIINTSPEPVTNWTASIVEDLAVIGALWAALNYPALFLVIMVLFIALVIWLMPKIWRALKTLYHRLNAFFKGTNRVENFNSGDGRSNTLKSLFHAASNPDNTTHK
jgi:ABC-type multidrug transport system permease subunit